MFSGKNIVHLPTVKTHVFTTLTGAMKNAFGGLLNRKRHWNPFGDPRDPGGPAQHPEGAPSGHFRRDGTAPLPETVPGHGRCGGMPRTSFSQAPTRWPSTPSRPRMMGFDPMSVKFIPAGPRAGSGVRRDRRHRGRWRGYLRGQLGLYRQREHVRQPGPEADLLGSTKAAGELLAAVSHSSVVVRSLKHLPQRLLATPHRPRARPRSDEDGLGQALPELLEPRGRR